LLTTDVIILTPNSNIFSVVGFQPSTGGIVTLSSYPTTNTINVVAENNTSSTFALGSPTVNYRVIR
jgi:hypothetical protein